MHEVQPRGTGFVGELPEGWVIRPMSEACTKVTDGTHGTPPTTDIGRPYVTAIHVKGGKIDFENCLYLSEEHHREIYNRCNPVAGDLAVVNIGAGVGECGFVDVDFEFSMKNVALLKPDPGILSSLFLYSIHEFRKGRIAHAVKSGGAQPFLSLRDLRKLPVLLPPLPEQRKIADILSTWDQAIEKTEALLSNARTQKRALMQQLLTGKRRFPAFEGQPWKEVRLGDVADIRIGGTPARKEPSYWNGGTNTWLSIADLGPKHLDRSKECITDAGVAKSNVKLLPTGSVVMSFKLTIGKLGITAAPLYTNEAICGFVPKHADSFVPEFLYQLLHVADLLQDVDQAVKGKTLNKAKINELAVRMPSISEQQKIADVLDSLDLELERNRDQVTKLRTEKKALMQQLLTGKRRVVV